MQKKITNPLSTGFFAFIILSVLCVQVQAESKADKLDQFLKECYVREQFNGTLLVAEKGHVIYKKSYGFANQETLENIQDNYRFRLASVSKQFTAMAVMILKEAGKLDFDDNMKKYLPELPYKNITIRHLLTHTSGMPDYITLMNKFWDPENRGSDKRKIVYNRDVVETLAKHHPKILFKPGKKWEYSNTGYLLLGSIVERVSGMPYKRFLKEKIFDKLDMNETLLFDPKKDQGIHRRVRGYAPRLDKTGYRKRDHHYLNGVAGDGGIYSTVDDLFLWDQALYTEKLVSSETLKTAFTPVRLKSGKTHPYGFGWSVRNTPESGKVTSHGGGWVGFVTYIYRGIDSGNTIIMLTNVSLPGSPLIQAVTNILHDKPFSYPKQHIALVLGRIVYRNGAEAAIKKYHELKSGESDAYDFSESQLNYLGYQLLNDKKISEAIAIFGLNVQGFPKSGNAYDSLAEAYMKNKDYRKSMENYKKSLKLNPKNNNAKEKLNVLRMKLKETE